MKFNLYDMDLLERKEYFVQYFHNVVCTYSMTVNLDITVLQDYKLYPAMLWLLTSTVNDMVEFRTSISPDGIGYFDDMHPSYTIFNKENKNFSDIWTEFDKDYGHFLNRYLKDVAQYSSATEFNPKRNRPINTFDVSMLPWTTFTAFNLNIYGNGKYLLPIFTMGKTFPDGKKTMLPLALQVHHAVCDGYHVGMFIQRLQSRIDNFPAIISPDTGNQK